MQVLAIGAHRACQVVVVDEPGSGGAHHSYWVLPAEYPGEEGPESFARVQFQDGPIQEVGINGCHQEDLLEIVAHRLACFQAGPFACDANQTALDLVRAAIRALDQRTAERRGRGVEGQSVA